MRFKAPGNRTPLQISDSSLMPTIKNFVTHYGRSEKDNLSVRDIFNRLRFLTKESVLL